MVGLLKKIYGDGNQKQLNRIQKKVDQIDAIEPEYENMSDDQVQEKTEEFKKRYKHGESLDDMLVEAYAVVREASKRILHMRPFAAQLTGVSALHEGNISDM